LKACDRNIVRTIALTQEMIRLADQGDADREDTGCGVLYGILRDSAFKLRQLADEEKRRHQAKGWWPAHCPQPSNAENSSQPDMNDPEKEKHP
jgi:hypothetical protein